MTEGFFSFQNKFLWCIVVSFLLYGNTLKNEYALDDNFVTTKDNITSKGISAFKEILTTHYIVEEGGTNTFEYRPLVKLSFALEHQFFGVSPGISHFFNIMLYALCLFLLLKVLYNLFSSYPPLFAELVVLFFAFIPSHTEVVASLKNRDILLAFILGMMSIISFIKFAKSQRYLYILSGSIFLNLSFFSKLDTLTFIILIPILLYLVYNISIKHFLIITLTLIASYYSFSIIMDLLINQDLTKRPVEFYENPLLTNNSFLLKLSTALNSLGFYIRLLLIPINMASYYGYNTIDVSNFLSTYSILAMLSLAIFIYIVYKTINDKKKPFLIGLVFLYIPMSMYLNLIKPVPGIVADRYTFTPSIGFSILCIYAFSMFLNKNAKMFSFKNLNINFKLLTIAVLITNFFIIFSRNKDWKNALTLYVNDSKTQPMSVKLLNLCGNEIIAKVIKNDGTIPQDKNAEYIKLAETSLKKVMSIDSNNIKTLNNLSFIYLNFYKNYFEAKHYISKAYQKDSLKHEVVYNMSLCNYNLGNLPEASKYIAKALTIKSTDNHTLELATEIYSHEKYTSDGINIILNILKNQPNDFKLNLILGNLFIVKKDTLNTVKYYQKAAEINPNDTQLSEMIYLLSR